MITTCPSEGSDPRRSAGKTTRNMAGALIVGRNAVAATADRAGVFVYGFAPEDYPRD